jgi:response regulator of citrate/malate metabolism
LLIVEDDPGVAFALRLWMNELPLRYVLASSAGEARELLRDLQLLQTPCDALLADFCLSDEHGTAFVREFRRAQPRAAVAVMTGAEDPVLETWLARERLPLLRKPLDLSSLCNWLMTWL